MKKSKILICNEEACVTPVVSNKLQKPKVFVCNGDGSSLQHEEPVRVFGKVKNIKATGLQSIVEILSTQEVLSSEVIVKGQSHQAIVVDTGPQLEVEKWGFKKGDRVLLEGKFVPVDVIAGKNYACVDPHAVKCVLEE